MQSTVEETEKKYIFPTLKNGHIEIPNQMIISYCSQDTSMLHGTIKEYTQKILLMRHSL